MPDDKEIFTVDDIERDLSGMPPGGGQFSIPPVQPFVAINNLGASRVYRNPDEAVRHSRANAKAMRRDLVILEPLRARMLATAELPYHIEPEEPKDAYQAFVAKEIQKILEEIPYWLQYKMSLLEAVFFGRYAVMNKYGWDFSCGGRKRLVVRDWYPIHGDSLIFGWGDDSVSVLVNPNDYGEGTKHLTTIPTDVSLAHKLTPWEREAVCIHMHERQAGDFFEPDVSGAIHGVGLRTFVYWTWYLKHEALGWLTEYMERVGTGITIYYYDRGNPQSEAATRKAAESQAFSNVILWPRMVGPEAHSDAPPIERIEPNSVGMENLMRIIDDYYGGLIKRYIVGQVLSSEANKAGSTGVAKFQEDTFTRIIRYDSTNLAETLTRDVVSVLMKYNYPSANFKCRFRFNVDKPDPEQFLRGAREFYNMGGALSESELREVLGLSEPTSDDVVLKRAMTDFEQEGGVEVDPQSAQGKQEDAGKKNKKSSVEQALKDLGANASVNEIKSYLESAGTKVSYTTVYNAVRDLRGAPTYQPKQQSLK